MSAAFFADTFYWVSLTNPRDSAHERVAAFSAEHEGTTILTTDEVLAEFLTFFATDLALRADAAGVVEDILQNPDVQVIPQSRSSFLAGLELYKTREDKTYSLTDCIAMETMRGKASTAS